MLIKRVAKLSNGDISTESKCGILFYPLSSLSLTEAYTLKITENRRELIKFVFMLGDGGVLCHYRSAVFSYTASNEQWKLEMIKHHSTKPNFYLTVTDPEGRDQMFKVKFTD